MGEPAIALLGHSFTVNRLPPHLQETLNRQRPKHERSNPLAVNAVHKGDARVLLDRIQNDSISLSVWSPPYFVGKSYESYLDFAGWQDLIRQTISGHFAAIKPGGFLVINIADILCFKDPGMPRVQAEVVERRKSAVTRQQVITAVKQHPGFNRHQLATFLGCSEQTIDRRLNGNNIRGGKHGTQTRVKIVGGLLEQWALDAGFYPYDRRVWVKDAAWENSRWASLSYRAVDEFEYLYFFWKPGITTVSRKRLTSVEWKEWGSRGVWAFPSVRANDDHEAKFPVELPLRAIKLLTDPNDIILDCFMGSGSTAIAALKAGRRFIGIELEGKSVELSRARIERFRHGRDAD